VSLDPLLLLDIPSLAELVSPDPLFDFQVLNKKRSDKEVRDLWVANELKRVSLWANFATTHKESEVPLYTSNKSEFLIRAPFRTVVHIVSCFWILYIVSIYRILYVRYHLSTHRTLSSIARTHDILLRHLKRKRKTKQILE
jgi:hypothetical protein